VGIRDGRSVIRSWKPRRESDANTHPPIVESPDQSLQGPAPQSPPYATPCPGVAGTHIQLKRSHSTCHESVEVYRREITRKACHALGVSSGCREKRVVGDTSMEERDLQILLETLPTLAPVVMNQGGYDIGTRKRPPRG
jgi:hypothetical protein